MTSKPVLMNTQTKRPVVFFLPLSTSPFLLLNFYSHFFSYYYLSYFPSLPLHICDIDKFFAKRFSSSKAMYQG
jgi:hypothetical protein